MNDAVRNPPMQEADGTSPLVIAIMVPCSPNRAFEYFTRDIARWWPLDTHSVRMHAAKSVSFEPRAGGRLYEIDAEGAEHSWGHVVDWQPGRRVAFTWHPGREASTAQHVEVTFERSEGGTEVTLTHSGWSTLGDRAAAARANYRTGWAIVLGDRYAVFCGR